MGVLFNRGSQRFENNVDDLHRAGNYYVKDADNAPDDGEWFITVQTGSAPPAHESGSVSSAAPANEDDNLTIDDGVHDPVTFTYKASVADDTDVLIGESDTDQASQLKLTLDAYVVAHPDGLNVSTSVDSNTVTIVNEAAYVGGSITINVGDNLGSANFAGGDDGHRGKQEAWRMSNGTVGEYKIRFYTGAGTWLSWTDAGGGE